MTPELNKAIAEFKAALSETPPFNWPRRILDSGYGNHAATACIAIIALILIFSEPQ